MDQTTIIELSDVAGKPKARLMLPSPLRVGDRIQLRFKLTRENTGRMEVLDVAGNFQVRVVSFDASLAGPPHQVLSVTSVDTSPSWKAVKRSSLPSRKMGPAKRPPTVIE
jgi:hypothetical protein